MTAMLGRVGVSEVCRSKRATRHAETLRPGVAIPAFGYLMSFIVAIMSLILIVHPGPQRSFAERWGGGELVMVWAWLIYKLGSNRIVLDEDTLRIIGWCLFWTVRRGEVKSVKLLVGPRSLSIFLTDGSVLEPLMFTVSSMGMIYSQGGLFSNAMSRRTIRDRIIAWNAGASAEQADAPPAPGRRWRVRYDIKPLLVASAVVAAEAIALTAANIWLRRLAFKSIEDRPYSVDRLFR